MHDQPSWRGVLATGKERAFFTAFSSHWNSLTDNHLLAVEPNKRNVKWKKEEIRGTCRKITHPVEISEGRLVVKA